MMIELVDVRAEDKTLLWNINQKYLYEMTNYYDDDMDADGNYHYGYFEEYFSDPDRHALFILCDTKLAGFAMINPYSYLNAKPDHVLAEFTVFPAFRKRHIASAAAERIFACWPGKWEIKYNEKNFPAKALWESVTRCYLPEKTHLNENETVLTFTV